MLLRIVYASSAVRPLGPGDLGQIVRTSRTNNAAVDVTGALLYHDGSFMQALEGPPAAVEAVYGRVEADPRHRGILTLLRERTETRAFPTWSMGLLDPEAVPEDGVVPLFDAAAPGPERAHRLLHAFRTVIRR